MTQSLTSSSTPATFGILAEFDGPGALLAAARATRKAGYQHFDVYSPYPVHGMDLAMGLNRSKLGWIVAGGAITGVTVAMGLQYYANVLDYPLITQGKPYFSWQAFLVVTFELAVLFSAFAAVFGMFFLNDLPAWYHPALKQEVFTGASDNRFFLAVEAKDEKFELEKTGNFLKQIGAISQVVLED